MSATKGEWGSSFGFMMAAVGSAVGLGNLWGFPYKMGISGGFAFLLIYLVLALLVGFVIMLGELTLGRKTGKGVIAAYNKMGRFYTPLGWMAFLCPLLILSFYCSLGGYCIKYTVANLGTLFHSGWGVNGAVPKDYFMGFVTSPIEPSVYALIFVILTVVIVMKGVSGGIESFSKIAMPMLFVMLVVVIIRGVTLPGAIEGLAFMFKPNFEVFKGTGWLSIMATAGGQMFFSLSLGMGIMVTYGSYLSKKDSLEKSAVIIPIADTIVAIMAGMAVMPAVFAMGMEPTGGPGLLFMTLQGVFDKMGAAGPIFGFLFYGLVTIAAVTSSISLFEVVIAVLIDFMEERGKKPNRTVLSIAFGLFLMVTSVLITVDALGEGPLPKLMGFIWLDFFDLLSEGIMMPLGSLLMALGMGWLVKEKWLAEEITLEGNSWKSKGFAMFCFKFVAPVGMAMVLLGQLDGFFKLGIF